MHWAVGMEKEVQIAPPLEEQLVAWCDEDCASLIEQRE